MEGVLDGDGVGIFLARLARLDHRTRQTWGRELALGMGIAAVMRGKLEGVERDQLGAELDAAAIGSVVVETVEGAWQALTR